MRKANEVLEIIEQSSAEKGTARAGKLFLLAVLAGAYIALGAQASAVASFHFADDPETYGQAKLASAVVFPVGLMMVTFCGAELFTGNCLMVTGLLDKKITASQLLRNWVIVYIGNFAGSLLIAAMIGYSGLWESGDGLLGAMTVKTAISKVSLPFGRALVLGILCNWLVCLAVWMAAAAKDATGKILAIFFCIGLFVLSGFEHSVANMYFIPAGIMASANDAFVSLRGLDASVLTVGNFLLRNLLPVTLGNMIGGAVFVGMSGWFAYKKQGN